MGGGGANWGEDREGIGGIGLPYGGGTEEEGMEGGRGAGVEKPAGEKVVLGRTIWLERPIDRGGGGLAVVTTLESMAGLAGGVVSIPLSSIIFPALHLIDLFYRTTSCMENQ